MFSKFVCSTAYKTVKKTFWEKKIYAQYKWFLIFPQCFQNLSAQLYIKTRVKSVVINVPFFYRFQPWMIQLLTQLIILLWLYSLQVWLMNAKWEMYLARSTCLDPVRQYRYHPPIAPSHLSRTTHQLHTNCSSRQRLFQLQRHHPSQPNHRLEWWTFL